MLFALNIFAKDYGNVLVDKVVSVYDGDTIKVNIKDYPPILGEKISIRINGIDTPEIKGKCEKEKLLAKKARDVVKSTLKNSKIIELKNIQRGKYFRIVADVYADNIQISEILVQKKLAVRYDGGTKTRNWCE